MSDHFALRRLARPTTTFGAKRAWLCSAGVFAAVGMAAALGFAAPASAAEAAAPAKAPVTDLGDVVVTARRVEERIQDVPVTVTALSQAKLDALVVNNIGDLAKLSPGLQVTSCVSGSSTGGASCSVNIRGFTSNRGSAFGTIAFYFADAADMFQSDYDLQSIQVLKGPQGTLFGDTVTGGALLFTPKKPSGLKNSGFITAEGGNLNYHQLTAAYENTFLDGKVNFRLSGQYRRRAGYGTVHYSFGGSGEVADVNQLYLRGSLVLKPIDQLENYTVALWQRDKTNGGLQPIAYYDARFFSAATRNLVPSATPASAALYEYFTGQTPPPGLTFPQIAASDFARQTAAGPDEVWSNLDAHYKQISVGVVNQTKWTFNDHWYIRNIYQLRWIPEVIGGNQNYDGSMAAFLQKAAPQVPTAGAAAFATNFAKVDNGWNNRQWTDEVQVVGDMFDNRLKLQGGYYHREDRPGDYYGAFPYRYPSPAVNQNLAFQAIAAYQTAAQCSTATFTSPVPCYKITTFERHSDAFYGQATWAVTDKLNLTAGGRQSKISPGITKTAELPTYFSNYTASNGVVVAVPVPVPYNTPIPGSPVTQTQQPGYNSFTYSLTADYKVDDDTLVYIAHRKGFKPGGTNPTLPTTDPLFAFGPETIKDVEIGVKRDWAVGGWAARTNVSIYKNWYDNIQTGTRQGGTVLVTINGGTADYKGAEFEGFITDPSRVFTLNMAVGYQNDKYETFIEQTSCSVQFYRQTPGGSCDSTLVGGQPLVPTSTLITIDHAHGTLTVAAVAPSAANPAGRAAQTYSFEPDKITPQLTWSLRPEIHLEPLLGENIVMGLNIYHNSGIAGGQGNGASINAGLAPYSVTGVYGNVSVLTAYSLTKYTQYDFSADWHNIHGSPLSAYLRVTNLANKRFRYGDFTTFGSGGTAAPSPNEPRMALVGVKYDF